MKNIFDLYGDFRNPSIRWQKGKNHKVVCQRNYMFEKVGGNFKYFLANIDLKFSEITEYTGTHFIDECMSYNN